MSVDVSLIYLHTRFHMLTTNGPLVISIKLKANCNFIKHIVYVPQKYFVNKRFTLLEATAAAVGGVGGGGEGRRRL
jgi:hypothetical protein